MTTETPETDALVKDAKILIVDDVPKNIQLIGSVLRNEGFRVVPATSGEEALRAVERHTPDLILLDVMMPEMDGYEVIKRLKANEATREIPVIFVTALSDEDDETKGLELGAVDYVTKPIKIPVAVARVKTHLALVAGSRELARQNKELLKAAELREDVERMSRHDLKSPLSSIIAFPDLIRMRGGLSEEQDDMLSRIKSGGYRILDMVERSLDMFKMEQGIYKFEPTGLDLIGVLREITVGLEPTAAAGGVCFELWVDGAEGGKGAEGGEDRFEIQGEELLCHSMFANLIKNALEAASRSGGAVKVNLERGEPNIIRIENPGEVPEAVRENFFEKYVTSGKESGTGLGTYSAALIARTQGGEIELDSSTPGATAVIVRMA